MTATPTGVRVRAYQVGFGDCLLVSVSYPTPLLDGRTEGHVLVDFGAKVLARGGPRLVDLAAVIAEHCGGHLDVVVVSHRHQDHVRGFGDTKARVHLDPLQPSVIVRPWTDRPVAEDVSEPASPGFLELLDTVADYSDVVSRDLALDGRALAERARGLAQLGVKNQQALAMLDVWVAPERTRWVCAGDVVDLDDLLPGVRLEVLGPPTLEQVPGLRGYASGTTEYWLGMTQDGSIAPELRPVAETEIAQAKELVAAPDGLGRAAWLLDQLQGTGHRQVLDIVEGFDEVLNNTSVVVLLTVGRRRMLLAGDAQVENWSYSLDLALGGNGRTRDRSLRERLARVDLYKVGHHGSRNATPRRLVELWRQARPADRPLCSVLSTRSGLYGTRAEGKVPSSALVEALQGLGPLHSTEDIPPGAWWFDVAFSTTSRRPEFEYRAGPPQR